MTEDLTLTDEERVALWEMVHMTGWSVIRRLVATQAALREQDVLVYSRPGHDGEERMFESGRAAGVREMNDYLNRVEESAAPTVAPRAQA
tara:strand:- start:934 stop:1203 length:270 start_codon:yes stop_codon:yes gene_type:complete